MKFLLSSLILITSLSCGLRKSGETYSNPLIKNWVHAGVECYYPDDRGDLKELYLKGDFETGEFNVEPGSFSYSLTKSNGTACNTSASGSYAISFTTTTSGSIDISDLVTSPTCEVVLEDSRGSGNNAVTFGFLGNTNSLNDLEWRIVDKKLRIRTSSEYKGSNIGSYCVSSCTCYNIFSSN